MQKEKEWITPSELANMLGTSAQMVRVSLRKKATGWESIRFLECGNRIKISSASVDEFLKGRVR